MGLKAFILCAVLCLVAVSASAPSTTGTISGRIVDAQGLPMSKDESREIVYGMPYDEWRKKHQKEASTEQKAAFEKSSPKH